MSLRRLDDRLLPKVAAAVQRAVDRVTPGRLRDRPPAGPAAPPPLPAPTMADAEPAARRGPSTGPAPAILKLRGVDDRFAASGLLRTVREVPQLGALVLAVIVLVAGATVFQRNRDLATNGNGNGTTQNGDGNGDGVVPVPDDQVGPVLGEDVEDYLQAAQEELDRRREDDPDTLVWSVISFDTYVAPDEVEQVVPTPPNVQFVLFRVPPTGEEADSEPERGRIVRDVAADALVAFRATARQRRIDAAEFANLAATSANDPAYQIFYATQAAWARFQAEQLTKGCRCIFAVIVKAPASLLAEVALVKGVRSVDVGPAGAEFATLEFRGLLPEEKVTVTGGNEGSPGGNG